MPQKKTVKKAQPASAPSTSAGARQGSSSGTLAASASHSRARPRSGNGKRASTAASASEPRRASPSGPSGARPTSAAAHRTSTGYTSVNGRPSLKTFHALAAQTSMNPADRATARIVLGNPNSRAGPANWRETAALTRRAPRRNQTAGRPSVLQVEVTDASTTRIRGTGQSTSRAISWQLADCKDFAHSVRFPCDGGWLRWNSYLHCSSDWSWAAPPCGRSCARGSTRRGPRRATRASCSTRSSRRSRTP